MKAKLLSLNNNSIFIKTLKNLIRSDEGFILLVFSLASFLLIRGSVTNLRTFLPLIILVLASLTLKLKDIVLSVFLTTLFSLQFFVPNKYYSIQILRGYELLLPEYKSGYWQGYGVNIFNIMWVLTLVAIFRDIIKGNVKSISIKKIKVVIPILFSFTLLYILSQKTIARYSPFFIFSSIWLAQYMQIAAACFSVLFIYLYKRKRFHLIYSAILFFIIFQSIISLWQYKNQSFIGLNIETGRGATFARGLDENNAVFRVAGTQLFHNQLALLMLTSLSIYLPYAINRKRFVDGTAILLGLSTILLTQSRSVWIATSIVAILTVYRYKENIKTALVRIGRKRLLLIALLLIIALSPAVVPRILLSFNAPYEGAGIPIRIRLMREAVQVLKESPFYGFGVGTIERTIYKLLPNSIVAAFPTVVHFGLLQMALEVGLIGLLLFLFPFLYLTRIWANSILKSKAPKPFIDNYWFAFLAGSLGFFIYYLFLPYIGIVEFQYLGILLGFGAISIINRSKRLYVKKS